MKKVFTVCLVAYLPACMFYSCSNGDGGPGPENNPRLQELRKEFLSDTKADTSKVTAAIKN